MIFKKSQISLKMLKINSFLFQPCKGPKPESSKTYYGPVMPSSFSSSQQQMDDDDEDDDDEDDVIGPQPPKPGEEVDAQTALAMQFEARAKKMKDKIEGKNEVEQPKRETW